MVLGLVVEERAAAGSLPLGCTKRQQVHPEKKSESAAATPACWWWDREEEEEGGTRQRDRSRLLSVDIVEGSTTTRLVRAGKVAARGTYQGMSKLQVVWYWGATNGLLHTPATTGVVMTRKTTRVILDTLSL